MKRARREKSMRMIAREHWKQKRLCSSDEEAKLQLTQSRMERAYRMNGLPRMRLAC